MNSVYSLQSIFTEFHRSMKLSLPLIATELICGISLFISTAVLGHLGSGVLAANVLVWSVFVPLTLFFSGVLFAIGILVAQSFGAKDSHGVQQATIQGIILSFVFAIPMVACMWFAPYILFWTKQDPKVIALAIPYFHAWTFCMLPINLLFSVEQFFLGIGKTRVVLAMSLIRIPIEIPLYYVLIFGKFGLPKCGLSGVAYAMSIAISIVVIAAIIYLHFGANTRQYKILQNCWRINKKYLFEIIRVGFPLAATFVLELTLFGILAFMMGQFGENVLAAHQIAYQCFLFALAIIFGLSNGTTVRIGHEVGRNNREGIKLAAYVNMGIGFCSMLILAGIYIGFPDLLIRLDITNIHKYHDLVHYAVSFLAIAGILQLSESFRLIGMGALRGLKDTKIPMYISALSFWLIAFPCAYLLAVPLHLGGIGIWWGLVIGLAVCAGILLIRFNKLAKKVNLFTLVTKEA